MRILLALLLLMLPTSKTIASTGNFIFGTQFNPVLTQTSPNWTVDLDATQLLAGKTLKIVQPSANSVVTLRLKGLSPHRISVSLSAPGHVNLVSPSELIVESTGSIKAGSLNITAPSIKIMGSLHAPAGRIELTGDEVTLDRGEVNASNPNGPGGEIIINGKNWVSLGGNVNASGTQGGSIRVETGGLSVAGSLIAKGHKNSGGTLTLNTQTRVIETSSAFFDVSGVQGGTIRHIAGSRIVTSGNYFALGNQGTGGNIDVTAPVMKLLSNTIDASGQTGGGRIRVGGEYQGGKGMETDELPNAKRIALTNGTHIRANALGTKGPGGRVILWSDEHSLVQGELSTLPGSIEGAGGLVETSSEGNLKFAANVRTGKPERMGELLMDPKNATVGDTSSINQMTIIIGDSYSGNNIGSQALDMSDLLGFSVSLEGNRLAVGASSDDGNAGTCDGCGAVYLYTFTDSGFNGGTLEGMIGSGYTGGKNIDQTLDNFDEFGSDVSLSGNRLAIGAGGDDGSGGTCSGCGAVYLYSFTNDTFSGGNLESTVGSGYTTGKNVAVTLENSDDFGFSVSLDGHRLAVGATSEDGVSNACGSCGAVYLFSFTNTGFDGGQLEGIIGQGYTGGKNIDRSGIENNDRFGSSVSLHGNRLALGIARDDGNGNTCTDCGAVELYTFSDNVFSGGTLEAIIGSGYTGGKNINQTLGDSDRLGNAVSLDGDRLAVAAHLDDGSMDGCNGCGAVYLYTFTGTSFAGANLEGMIGNGYTGGKNFDQSLAMSDQFGTRVSLDGNRLAIGAPRDDGDMNACTDCGGVYLFTFSDLEFSDPVLKTQIGNGYAGGQNVSISLDNFDRMSIVSLDGNRMAIGVGGDAGNTNTCMGCGAVYLYSFSNAAFASPTLEAIIGSGYTGGKNINQTLDDSDIFGSSVSLDGTRLAVGAFGDDGNGGGCNACGAVYLFSFTDMNFTGGTQEAIIGDGYAGGKNVSRSLDDADFFGISVALDGTQLAIGATGDSGVADSCMACGAVFLYTFTDMAFTGGSLQAIIGSGYTGGSNINQTQETADAFGTTVSLDNNRLAVGANLEDGNGNACNACGAVYLFSFTNGSFAGGTLESTIGSGYSGGKNIDFTLADFDRLGTGVSLDGTRLAVGTNGDDGAANTCPCGAVHLFTFTDTAFNGGTLTASIGEGYTGGKNINQNLDDDDRFGSSVSLDGNRVAVGSNQDAGSMGTCMSCGAIFLYPFQDSDFNSGGDPIANAWFNLQAGQDLTLSSAALADLLATPTAVNLQVNNDLTIASDVIVNNISGDGGSLTLQAGRSVLINANITTDNGMLKVFANDNLASGVIDHHRDPGKANISMMGGTTINTGTAPAHFEIRPGTGKTFHDCGVITDSTILAASATFKGCPESLVYSVVSPYWQADTVSYTFLAISHASLKGMNSQIGVILHALQNDGSIYADPLEFTVTQNSAQQVFIVPSNNPALNPITNPNGLFIIGSQTVTGRGSLRFSPVATDPLALVGTASSLSRGYPDIRQLNFWGAVIVQNTVTGFAMEFIGDNQDSRTFNTPYFSGLN